MVLIIGQGNRPSVSYIQWNPSNMGTWWISVLNREASSFRGKYILRGALLHWWLAVRLFSLNLFQFHHLTVDQWVDKTLFLLGTANKRSHELTWSASSLPSISSSLLSSSLSESCDDYNTSDFSTSACLKHHLITLHIITQSPLSPHSQTQPLYCVSTEDYVQVKEARWLAT